MVMLVYQRVNEHREHTVDVEHAYHIIPLDLRESTNHLNENGETSDGWDASDYLSMVNNSSLVQMIWDRVGKKFPKSPQVWWNFCDILSKNLFKAGLRWSPPPIFFTTQTPAVRPHQTDVASGRSGGQGVSVSVMCCCHTMEIWYPLVN